eukprot:UN12133
MNFSVHTSEKKEHTEMYCNLLKNSLKWTLQYNFHFLVKRIPLYVHFCTSKNRISSRNPLDGEF